MMPDECRRCQGTNRTASSDLVASGPQATRRSWLPGNQRRGERRLQTSHVRKHATTSETEYLNPLPFESDTTAGNGALPGSDQTDAVVGHDNAPDDHRH